jgi:hypothetical protein
MTRYHTEKLNSPLFELASVLVRLNHVASFIVNANHSAALQTYYDFEDFDFTSDSPGLQATSIGLGDGFFALIGGGNGTNVNAVTPSTTVGFLLSPFFHQRPSRGASTLCSTL